MYGWGGIGDLEKLKKVMVLHSGSTAEDEWGTGADLLEASSSSRVLN